MLEIIFLQASGNNYSQFIMLGGMVAIFYFFFIRPQQKKQKDTKKFIEAVKKGDMVVTLGGIHGKVFSVDEATITLDVDRGKKLVVESLQTFSETKNFSSSFKSPLLIMSKAMMAVIILVIEAGYIDLSGSFSYNISPER